MIVSDDTVSIDAIGFGYGNIAKDIPRSFDLAFHLTLNEFRGQKKLQIQIIDFASKDG